MTAAASIAEEPAVAPAPCARRDLEITDPDHDGGRYVVHDPRSGRFLQVGHSAAAVLRALDGRRTLAEIAAQIGGGATAEQLAPAIAVFREHGLLQDDGDVAASPRPDGLVNELDAQRSRVRRTGMLSVQVDLLDPSRVLARCPRVARALTGSAFWATAALAVAVVALAGALQAGRLSHVLSTPLPAAPALIALLALFPTIVAHEFAHAAVAWRQGARARRMGVMLLYLAPSAFCDVSDCWRLPRRSQRVRVAGAGIALQTIAAALALGASLLPGLPPAVVTALLLYGAANVLLAVVNLLPFVRLDGYLMLMSALDIPHLRAKAIADARALAARIALGRPAPESHLRRRVLAVPFGVACALTPPLIAAYGLTRAHALLLPFGAPGALAWLLALGLLALALVRRGVRALRGLAGDGTATPGSRAAGPPSLGPDARAASRPGSPPATRTAPPGPALLARGALVLAALGAAAVVLGTSVSRPRTVTGAFALVDGQVRLLVAPAQARTLHPGERVLLREPGLLGSTTVASATIAPGAARTVAAAPAPSPIEGFGGVARRIALPLRVSAWHGPALGSAVVQTGHQSLFSSLAETYLTSASRLLNP